MHLAFLTPEYPHPLAKASAGIGSSIKNMALALSEKGIKISIFIYAQQENTIFEEKGIKFHFIQQKNYHFSGWYSYRKYLQKYLNKYIVEDHIDALEAPDWTGITAFMKLKCPLVIRMNGTDTYFCDLEHRPQKKKNFWFEKQALKKADHLLSVSEFTAQKSRELFSLEKEITVIPNSINTEKFQPMAVPVIPKTILYFGSIIRKKGVLELAEIFNEVVKFQPNAQLIMAGKDVPDYKTGTSTKHLMIQRLSREASQKIKWLGNLKYEDVENELVKAHVVVLPSFAEALPMTWIEAMAMEKALVTSNIGWAEEVMINGQTGFAENPEDHKAFAEKILKLLNDPFLCQKLGKAARIRVEEKFSARMVAEKNIKFYKKILSLRGGTTK